MIEPVIVCPSCATEIKLTESLAAPLILATRQEYERKLALKEADVSNREAAVRLQQQAVADAQKSVDEQVAAKLKTEREKIANEESRKAKQAAAEALEEKSKELLALQERLAQQNTKLAEAQKAQAGVLKKSRELDDAKREIDLTIEKQVQAKIGDARLKARQEAEDGLKLKVAEREETIASMQRQIEELKRRAEQGSQQLRGEVMELELEQILQARFPLDIFEPVGKGESGADLLQRVVNHTGQSCGSILWESKRTKNWSDGWLAKLRADQRNAQADIAVLVSHARHKDIESFGHLDGIWVTEPRFVIPLVIALRQTLFEIANARQMQNGQRTKMELVYAYLTGPKFRHRVEAIVEKFSDMQADLDRERKTMTRLWAKREAQIAAVIESTVGMYGDLQGIAGRAIQEIEGLGLPMIEDDTIS